MPVMVNVLNSAIASIQSDVRKLCGIANVFDCCAGITDYLTTEISTSKQKKFSLVTFVDTPGLVDGDMKYPFDVNRAILWLGEASSLHIKYISYS